MVERGRIESGSATSGESVAEKPTLLDGCEFDAWVIVEAEDRSAMFGSSGQSPDEKSVCIQ
jgi:hypothetical protein